MTQLGALLDSLTHCKRSTSASLICLGISKGSLEEQSEGELFSVLWSLVGGIATALALEVGKVWPREVKSLTQGHTAESGGARF